MSEIPPSEQMEALRLCNFLLHVEDRSVPRALLTMLKSLAALSEARAGTRC